MNPIAMNLFTPNFANNNIEGNTPVKQAPKADKTFEKAMDKIATSKRKAEDSKTSSRRKAEDIRASSKENTTAQESTKDSLNDVKALGKKESVIAKEDEDKTTTANASILNEMMSEGELIPLLNDLDLEQVMQLLPIIGTIMEQLDVSLKQVVETMEQMGINSEALADPKVFGEFIANLYEVDTESLLMNSGQLKDVNKLLEKIQHITENVNLSDMQVAIEKMVIGDKVITETTKVTAPASVEAEEALMQANALPEKVMAEQMGNTKKDTKLSSEVPSLSEDGSKGLDSSSIGIQIPITAIDQSSQTKLWNESSKTSSFTETMKGTDIPNQIIEKFELNTLREGKEITMELSPKELGKLTMKLTEHQGMITASIKVDNEKTREMLMQNIEQLKTNLEEQGLTVGQFEVNVRDDSHKSEMEKQKQKSSKRIGELLEKHLQAVEEEPEEQIDSLKDNEIDYMA